MVLLASGRSTEKIKIDLLSTQSIKRVCLSVVSGGGGGEGRIQEIVFRWGRTFSFCQVKRFENGTKSSISNKKL